MNSDAKKPDPTRSARRIWSTGGITLVAALCAGWYALAVKPQLAHVDQVRQSIDQCYVFLEREQSIRTTVNEAKEAYDQLASQWELAKQRNAADVDYVVFLTWLAEQTRPTALKINDYRPAGITDYGDYHGRKLQLSATGEYEAVCTLLDELRRCPQMNRVTDLSIASSNPQGTEFALSIQLELLSLNTPDTTKSAPKS